MAFSLTAFPRTVYGIPRLLVAFQVEHQDTTARTACVNCLSTTIDADVVNDRHSPQTHSLRGGICWLYGRGTFIGNTEVNKSRFQNPLAVPRGSAEGDRVSGFDMVSMGGICESYGETVFRRE